MATLSLNIKRDAVEVKPVIMGTQRGRNSMGNAKPVVITTVSGSGSLSTVTAQPYRRRGKAFSELEAPMVDRKDYKTLDKAIKRGTSVVNVTGIKGSSAGEKSVEHGYGGTVVKARVHKPAPQKTAKVIETPDHYGKRQLERLERRATHKAFVESLIK